MRIAINTSCAVAGGAVTHLRYLLPELVPLLGGDELVLIGEPGVRRRIDPTGRARWREIAPIRGGIVGRVAFENAVLPRLLRELAADVLFHPGNFSAFRAGIPQVNLLHNLAPFLPSVIEGESRAQKLRFRLLRGLTHRSLAVARRMIFISRWGRSLVLGDSRPDERRFPIVPFGADHAGGNASGDAGGPATIHGNVGVLERFGLRPDGFLLSVSHIYRYKHFEKIVDAHVRLGERVAGLPLVIVGEPYDAEYARSIAALGGDRVVFTDGLPTEALIALMQSCRAFLFSSEAENLPITLLEAMAAGCAILTNRTCSMPEVCGDAADYADPATGERYAERLLRMLDDDAHRAHLQDAARRRAAGFRWRNTAEQTLRILREVASER